MEDVIAGTADCGMEPTWRLIIDNIITAKSDVATIRRAHVENVATTSA
jgi:hypothetical protein